MPYDQTVVSVRSCWRFGCGHNVICSHMLFFFSNTSRALAYGDPSLAAVPLPLPQKGRVWIFCYLRDIDYEECAGFFFYPSLIYTRVGTRRKTIHMSHPTAVWVGKGLALIYIHRNNNISHTPPKTHYPHLNCAFIHCLVSRKLDYMSMAKNKFDNTSLPLTHFHARRQIAAALLWATSENALLAWSFSF